MRHTTAIKIRFSFFARKSGEKVVAELRVSLFSSVCVESDNVEEPQTVANENLIQFFFGTAHMSILLVAEKIYDS